MTPLRPWTRTLILGLCVLGLTAACRAPIGDSRDDKRAAVRQMRDRALAKLYSEAPSARSVVEGSVGYAVFSSVSTKILFVASGRGYGIAHDQSSGVDTYMRMIELGGGVGFGIKDVRVIFAFMTRSAFRNFLELGLDIGGDADVALKAGEQGGSVAVTENVLSLTTGDVRVFQLTEAGAAAAATVTAAKYYVDDELN